MDLPHFCHTALERASSSLNFHPSAWEFLNALDLPTIHPHCLEQDSNPNHINDLFISVAKSLPLTKDDYNHIYQQQQDDADHNWMSQLLTLCFQIAPAIFAITELWVRLIAFYIAPLSIYFMIRMKRKSVSTIHRIEDVDKKKVDFVTFIFVVTSTLSSMILLVDTFYVFTYGRIVGLLFFVTSITLSIHGVLLNEMHFYRRHIFTWLLFIISLTSYLFIHSYPVQTDYYFDHPGLDIPTIKEGLYFSNTNSFISSIVKHWPEKTRTYNIFTGATPYLPTGDSLTGIPFLVNSSPTISYERRWVVNKDDFEAVAIDIAFPSNGIYNSTKPMYLILHGLYGGSHDEFVKDFVSRSTKEGSTCIVMIARGMMDTPVRGWNVFHGARTTDIEAVAQAVRKSIGKLNLLIGVGFSMGAIILSNYVAKSGAHCQLDAAMAVSGGLDMRENLNFRRSMRLWQPILAKGLRDEFIVNKFYHLFLQRLKKEQVLQLMRASSITGIDLHAIVNYNGYSNLLHYYSDMSAMGDSTAFQYKFPENMDDIVGKIENVKIPFCVLHALDDPLVTWRVIGHNPSALVNAGQGNILLLLTKTGGHVGWPIGLNPRSNGWKWMNDAVIHFTMSVDKAQKELLKGECQS